MQLHQQKGMISLSPPTICNSAPALQERLRQLHPYELPELLAVEAASGLPEYLQWLAAESRPVN
uniref:Periplasmic divalent cation tolerance protein CutA n=1 Tax=Escherichia coli TaxID=562 RepID=A0A6G6AN23_ECOLX|nr:Periplasmic divalent cation tolerance protein CutA [Escherichia coli]